MTPRAVALARAALDTPLGARLRGEVRRHATVVVRDELAPRREAVIAATAAHDEARRRLPGLAAGARTALYLADTGPFRPTMTVHAAHARHPKVRAAFAARGLPACPDCAVGGDETLAEAAFGELFDLEALLAELNDLLASPGRDVEPAPRVV